MVHLSLEKQKQKTSRPSMGGCVKTAGPFSTKIVVTAAKTSQPRRIPRELLADATGYDPARRSDGGPAKRENRVPVIAGEPSQN